MSRTVMDEAERRVLSHLSIPRNVVDLCEALRTDRGYQPIGPGGRPLLDDMDQTVVDGAKVRRTLEDMAAEGYVVNLGEHDDMARLAHKVEKSKARTMPDEKAEIFARRRVADHHRWRVRGDVWMMTDDGRDASRAATQLNVPPPMTTSELRGAIENEWARTLRDVPLTGSLHDANGGTLPGDWDGLLGGALLPEEFSHWLGLVLPEHERVWGAQEARALKASLPMAGGSQYSDANEIVIVDNENQKATITSNAPWHMALVETTAITDADTGSTLDEPEYTGYARKTVAAADMNAGSGTSGAVTNANAIVFAACTLGTDTAIGFANCVALTVGAVRKFGTCASTVISTTQTPAQFAVGAYTTTVA